MMRNRPHYELTASNSKADSVPMSQFRMRMLTLVAFSAFFVISCRIFVLHQNRELFDESRDATLELQSPIPVRDGRILTADGIAVAYDRERFDLAIHYRWLEEPPNSDWLRIMAKRELSSSERKSEEAIANQIAAIISRRKKLREDLCGYLGVSVEEFDERRAAIQKRVERIIQSVNHRRLESRDSTEQATEIHPFESVQSFTKFVARELTTPPRRVVNEQIVVQEELDYHSIFEDIPRELALHIESHSGLFPGTQVNVKHNRMYEYGTFLSSIVGLRKPFVHEKGNKFAADKMSITPNVRTKGQSGIELAFDRVLRGIAGERTITTLRSGETVHAEVSRPSKPGRDIVLTIHSQVQRRLEQLLDKHVLPIIPVNFEPSTTAEETTLANGGCILVVDIRSGEIVASATAPRPNLTLLADGDPEYWDLIRNDERGPLMPRMTHLELPPGSVFKIVSTVAMLEDDARWSQRILPCQGYLNSPNRHRCYIFRHYGVGHGDVDLQRAIRESCNVFFFKAANEIGPKALIRTASQLGFGHPTGIELPNEKSGNVPSPEKGKWYPGDTLGLSIGQSSLLVTPLQIAQLMAVVANDGYEVPLHVVRQNNKEKTRHFPSSGVIPVGFNSERRPIRRSVIPEETARQIQQAMKSVVEHRRGTGHKAVFHDAVTIAGKTGTAEVGGSQGDHAWFAGFTPADSPKYAFVVVLEHAGSGGRVAGPIAKEVVSTLLNADFIQPDRTNSR